MRPPAPRPCISCPYRRDVPSGIWDETEYAKLEQFDGETWSQPTTVFLCHQQDGRLCAGWVACHDMAESFGLRVACLNGRLGIDELEEVYDYQTDVPVFGSGAEAAAHGRRLLDDPPAEAVAQIKKLVRKVRP